VPALPDGIAPASTSAPQGAPASLPAGVPEGVPSGLPGIPAASNGVPSGPSSLSGVPAFPAGDVSYVTRVPGASDASVAADPSSGLPTSSSYDFRPEVVPDLERTRGIFDPNAVKRDFPILRERIHGRPLVWFDNAATKIGRAHV
jgi:cysteine desulfurase/selenocysteine lyase